MAEKFRFRAFISYSHRDERWAKWLHRALESYRVPKKLVGQPGAEGPVPQYFAPVFRDRDELPTSPDLSEQVRRALRDSGALIVVCSPAAASSKWVNEEIRRFREMGRADRIFCLIVDGDPEARSPGERCFPPALFEGDDGERHEPLAADARKFGDGKALARLKLVAGILGVRLDALRQREALRRRNRRLASGLGAVAAVALLAVAITSTVTQRSETRLVDEWIASIVESASELEAIEGSADVGTVRLIGGRLTADLDKIDPTRLTVDQQVVAAKALRSLGKAYKSSDLREEALRWFRASLDRLDTLALAHPDDPELLMERGIAHFHIGEFNHESGLPDAARVEFERYRDDADAAVAADPDNPAYRMQAASARVNLAVLQYYSGAGDMEVALAKMDAAGTMMREAIDLEPGNAQFRSEYGGLLAWLGDTRLASCDLAGALTARMGAVSLTSENVAASPGSATRRLEHARRLVGLGTVQQSLGSIEPAVDNYEAAIEIVDELAAADRQNVNYRWDVLAWRSILIGIRANAGQMPPEEAVSALRAVGDGMEAMLAEGGLSALHRSEHARHLVRTSETAWMAGDTATADAALRGAFEAFTRLIESDPDNRMARQRLALARFVAWEQGREDLAGAAEAVTVDLPAASTGANCEVTALSARAAILEGDRPEAERRTAELIKKGYFEPGFVRFCRRHGLCAEG